MSLLNSQYTYYDLQGADQRIFRAEVDRLAKESDHSLHTDSNGPPPKRPRMLQLEDSGFGSPGLIPGEYPNEWDSVSGTVLKLTLEDFLCHKHFELSFNPKINFIVGRNGSGKSAILTALVVALGGNAASTGRGHSLKDFVRNGSNVARVTCVINNGGHIRYKYKEYGSRIVIVRTIHSSGGSNVVLKSEKGKKISSTKEELRNMTLTLGIQVDNPISVLDQNTARHFLNDSSPNKKFELFMKATNLDSINSMYTSIRRDIAVTEQDIAAKEKQLEENSAEVREAQRKYDMVQNLESDRQTKDVLQHEYLWALHQDNAKAVEKVEDKLNKIQTEQARLSEMVAGGGTEEKILQQIESVEKEIAIFDSQESEKDIQIKTLKQEAQGIAISHKQTTLEKQQLSLLIKNKEEEIVAYKSEIEAQEQRMMPDHIENRRRQKEKVQALQKRLEDRVSDQKSKDSKVKDLQNTLSHVHERINQSKMLRRNVDEQSRRITRDLEGLQAQSSNLAVFGPHMPEIVRNIEEAFARGQFQKKPIGPLGAYVKVKDPKWTLAVEATLGRSLRTFAVDNGRDERQLLSIMKRVTRGGSIPSVICTKFYDKVHDTSRTCVQCEQYTSVLDMIDVSDPIAANMLIEMCSIEVTLLIPTDKECQRLLSDQRNVPRNCRRAYTVEGDIYFPAPSFRTYAGQAKKARYLQASREDIIRESQERLIELQASLKKEVEVLKDSLREEVDVKRQIAELLTEKRRLQSEIIEIRGALEELKDQEQPEVNTVSTLKKDLEEQEEECENKKKDLEEMTPKLQELAKKLEDVNILLRKTGKDIDTIRRQRRPLRQKVNALKEELRELQASMASAKRKLENLANQEQQVQKEKEECQAICESSKLEAEQFQEHLEKQLAEKGVVFTSRSNTRRPSVNVEQELNSLIKKLRSVERALGDSAQNIMEDYLEKHQIYNTARSYMDSLHQNVNYLQKALQIRKSLYHTQKTLMCAVVSHQFTRVLRYRNHVGSLTFNAEHRTLSIKSSPMDGTDRSNLGTESLSGGERSYTTMAFVIALWNVTELPFYFMDEFDVFMDRMNRQIVLSLMLRFAKQKRWYQFGFLTPLETTAVVASDDVSIFKLDDPRPIGDQ